ncbi:MAG: hypothetical protein LBF40_10625 [Deltaproteobacteria bacterium]|jgi:ABC-type branched-subunit amino acid transport system substrate-binding protein|nr:hypothetical protein [Deltaproteobacteria bacterium]
MRKAGKRDDSRKARAGHAGLALPSLLVAVIVACAGAALAQGGAFAPEDAGPAGPADGAMTKEEREALAAELEAAQGLPPAILFAVRGDGDFQNFGRSAISGARLAHKAYGGGFELIEESEGGGPLPGRVANFARVRAAAGHLFEGSLEENAPYYRRYGIPVLLPYLDNWETGLLGGGFYQLMPNVPAQARLLADRTLRPPTTKLARIVILETPAAPFELFADTYVATLKDPQALSTGRTKRRALPSKVKILRYVMRDMRELPMIIESSKLTPQDYVVLALSGRQAVQAAPFFVESNFQKAIFLGGTALATRDTCLAYLAANLNLELVLPLDLRNTKIQALSEFVHRYRIENKQEPAWPSVLAYDAVALAIKASSVPQASMYLDGAEAPEGLAGSYAFSEGKVPGEVVRVNRDSTVYYP